MLWLNLLHFYQPANIDQEKLFEATDKSYRRILRALEEHPNIKFTLNLAGCLIVRWDEEYPEHNLIKRFARLIRRGQVELTGGAAYHALLPLVSEREAERQIIENEKIIRKYFGSDINTKGFFLPELAYSPNIARLIKKLGYRWLILDEITAGKKIDTKNIFLDQNSGLKIIFRHRLLSESYVPEKISKLLSTDNTIVSTTDAELYGLRHLDQPASFEKLLKSRRLITDTISGYINQRPVAEKLKLVSSSWQSTADELKNHNPFSLWQNPGSDIHQRLWQLANLAEQLYTKHKTDSNRRWSRWHLVRGLASCTFWWASQRDLRRVFGPLAWSPDMVKKGIDELASAIRSLEKSTNLQTKLDAEKMIADTRKILWQTHWLMRARKRLN